MAIELTWLGHATWRVGIGNATLLIDPYLNDNPSAKVSADEVDADYVLITHGHFDHVLDAAAIANRCQATLIANFEIANWFADKHRVANTVGMNLGGSISLPFGKLTMTLALHSSGLPDGAYGGNAAGYLIDTGEQRVYFSGDTALFSDLQLIARKELDVAVLPIGDQFTMGPEDCIEAIKLLRPRFVVPSHFGTWPPIAQDAQKWANAVHAQTSATAIVPQIGQPFTV